MVGTPWEEAKGILFTFSYGEYNSAYWTEYSPMRRDAARILPYCPFCGEYKGVGPCRNTTCRGSSIKELDRTPSKEPVRTEAGVCIVCKGIVVQKCVRCKRGYCIEHSEHHTANELLSVKQHLGTCISCGQIVCEYCWILDERGKILCLQHSAENAKT